MKVHKLEVSPIHYGFEQQALESWEREGLIPHVQKLCTGLMVKSIYSLTTKNKHVTCKHCLRKIQSPPSTQ